jgi:hypothetical protein
VDGRPLPEQAPLDLAPVVFQSPVEVGRGGLRRLLGVAVADGTVDGLVSSTAARVFSPSVSWRPMALDWRCRRRASRTALTRRVLCEAMATAVWKSSSAWLNTSTWWWTNPCRHCSMATSTVRSSEGVARVAARLLADISWTR